MYIIDRPIDQLNGDTPPVRQVLIGQKGGLGKHVVLRFTKKHLVK